MMKMITYIVGLLTILLVREINAQSFSSTQTNFTDATDCSTDATIATKARINAKCIDLDDSTQWLCSAPTGGASNDLCDEQNDWLRLGARICSHATDVRTNVAYAIKGEICVQTDDGISYTCATPEAGGSSATYCDDLSEWTLAGDGQTANTLQDVCDGECEIGTAVAEGSALLIGNTALSKFWKLWCDAGGCVMKADPAQDFNVSIATSTEFNLYRNDGTTLLMSMTEAGTWAATSTTTINYGSAAATTPSKIGTAAPGTCTVGQVFFDTDASAGSNWLGCTATNTWTTMSGSGSINAPATLTAASDGTETMVIQNAAAATKIRLGTKFGDSSIGAIYFGVGTPSATNYALNSTSDGNSTNLNGLLSTYIATANVVRGHWDAGGLNMNGSINWPYGSEDVGFNRKAAGILEVNSTTAIGTTVANARHLLMGRLQLAEQIANPSAAELSVAGSNTLDTVHAYIKANKLVFAYNNAGSPTFITLSLDGSDVSLSHSTTAP